MQEQKSEERQTVDCNGYAVKARLNVIRVFSDRGKTGTSITLRTALLAMLEAARRQEVDVVLVEDIDRLGRKLSDLLFIYEELQSCGVELHDVQNGRLERIHVVIRGYISEEGRIRFLALSKAGKQNAVRNGRMMGKAAYGYRQDINAQEKGQRILDPHTSVVVQDIFKSVASGVSAGMVARKLTADGVPPPAQEFFRHNGGEIVSTKAWQPNTILKIVRNHLYIGFVTWGTTVPVHDKKTRRRVRFEATDESTWIVVQRPDLMIVDDELWLQANLKVSDLAYPGVRNGRKFLLTGRAVCGVCGAPLRAQAQEYHSYYVCTGRRLGGDAACSHSTHHRIDWLETAVIKRLMAEVLEPGVIERFEETFTTEIARLVDGEVRRRGVIERRLERIDQLQLRSFDSAQVEGFSQKRVAEIRKDLEAEAERLGNELSTLRRPGDFRPALDSMRYLHDHIEDMLASVPFRPEDAAGVALAEMFRSIVFQVRVTPPNVEGLVHATVVVDPLQTVTSKIEMTSPALAALELDLVMDLPALRKNAQAALAVSAAASGDAASADRRHDLSDAEWAIVEPHVSKVDFANLSIEPRLLFNGILCVLKQELALPRVPARYGEPNEFKRALRRLIYWSGWDAAVAALKSAGASCLEGVDTARFDNTEFPRRLVGSPPDAVTAFRDVKTLMRLARNERSGDPVRIRCELVVMILRGMPISEAARVTGVSRAAAYHHWDKYKARGVAALRRKVRKPDSKFRLNLDQVEQLRTIAETGVDPADPDKPITYPILTRICFEKFNVKYSVGGVILICRRLGIKLGEYVIKQRRERRLREAGQAIINAAANSSVSQDRRRISQPDSRRARRAEREKAIRSIKV